MDILFRSGLVVDVRCGGGMIMMMLFGLLEKRGLEGDG